ncbi:MAG: hypothetical protein PHT94_00565 [Candidatus Nanoarchaeia archaeon]|nr:hypothetical protein [Candidatus Nanoarchaeia archaeon]
MNSQYNMKIIECYCEDPSYHIIVKEEIDTGNMYIFYPLFHCHHTYIDPKPFNAIFRLFSLIKNIFIRNIEFQHDSAILSKQDAEYLKSIDNSLVIEPYQDDGVVELVESMYFEKSNMSFLNWLYYIVHGCLKFNLCKEIQKDGIVNYYLIS